MTVRVGIVGGTGFTGGELLRLLHTHPQAEVTQVTSRSEVGKYVYQTHPNLRGATALQYIHPDDLADCDVLFLCLPHGVSASNIEAYANKAERIIDLSADFRLKDTAAYERWYGKAHPAPEWLNRFTYGLPEINREQLRDTNYASGVGCNATAVNLTLMPLVAAGLVESVTAELKVGSSESGAVGSSASHHPIRSGAVRAFRPTGHRHMAEVQQVLGEDVSVQFSVTGIEMIRGVHLLGHCRLTEPVEEKTIWKTYRKAYKREPFIRFVSNKTGFHRFPEPRIVAGTNFCDIGFEIDNNDPQHLVVIGALDNLVKGAAGSAVQCMNLMHGFEETAGLEFTGIYP